MRWRTTLVLIFVFLLGIAAGVGLARGYPNWRAHWHKPAPHHDRQWFIHHMQQKLGLNNQQTQQFSTILDDARGQYHQLHQSCRQRFQIIHHQVRNQVRAMLTPAQEAKFNAWLKARAKKRQAQHGPAPPHS